MHYTIIYAYSLLRNSYMFRRYYLAIVREVTTVFIAVLYINYQLDALIIIYS